MAGEHDSYLADIESDLEEALAVAEAARSRGGDPEPTVEIPVAKDMADRVENLLEIDGVADRIRDLDGEMSREEAALALAGDFADGTVGSFETAAEKVEGAVRTAVALLTEGVVAAPIEGIDGVELLTNDDGSQFVNIYYAGPIRSAGGTAQAMSVLVADYTRALLDLAPYDPREEEVERYVEELDLYDAETGLQYTPGTDEARFIARNLPVMLDGEATGDREVAGYRDIDRVDTNAARGGMCLVFGEGIAQKANKLQRYLGGLDEVQWPWLEELVAGGYADEPEEPGESGQGASDSAEEQTPRRPAPSDKYLRDLIAGRPVLSHPSTEGGFRLRYGRARNHGFATAGVHPATMHIVDDFLATGTQLKTERPGKAAGVVPVDSIEGPTVRLANGDVRRIDDPEEARSVRNGIEAIIDLGEYLVNVGEFIENNHELVPASYVFEWWIQEFEAAGAPVQAFRDDPHVSLEHPDIDQALSWARSYDAPLHPVYTYQWHDLTVDTLVSFAKTIERGRLDDGTLVLERTDSLTDHLETIVVEHHQDDDLVTVPEPGALLATLGIEATEEGLTRSWTASRLPENSVMEAVSAIAPFTVRERAPTRIGARMGRPEKSERRELKPAVHTLFPIGDAGGDQRDVAAAAEYAPGRSDRSGVVPLEVVDRVCPSCSTTTVESHCPECDTRAETTYHCRQCDRSVPDGGECPSCETESTCVERREVDIGAAFSEALEHVGERATAFDQLKGVKGLTSRKKIPEPMEKGILRAKHGVSVFKDGTCRYDMTDLPVTSVSPEELSVSVDRFRSLGYETDIHGDPLVQDDQLVELQTQDIVLSDGAASYLLDTAAFVDDLLESYYGLEPYYEFADREDLVGELVFGMAPHTSAAVVGRVVGFTSAAVGYAHPYFHAAKRRNCDGDEDCVMLLLDGLLNFSKAYLPSSRGGRMDAPLVMTSRIDPTEIDDEAHNVDVVESYPLELYEASLEMAHPAEVSVELAKETVETGTRTTFRHTHQTSNIALGPDLSAYKTLDEMVEKMDNQLELARTLAAVEETDVAERVIESHLLPDLIGNLRAFSGQSTRCTGCGRKYRRPPLSTSCRTCGGNMTLTVHEGSVKKYLQIAIDVADDYGCRDYTKQRLEVLERSIESIFQDDTNKPSTLSDYMGAGPAD